MILNLPKDINLFIFYFLNLKDMNNMIVSTEYKGFINFFKKRNEIIKDSKSYTWRFRPEYFKYIELYKIKNKLNITNIITETYQNENSLSAHNSFFKWKIYENNKNIIASIKKKKNIYVVKRFDNSYWFSIKIIAKPNKPRKIYIHNIENRNYEDISNVEEECYVNKFPKKNKKKNSFCYNLEFVNKSIIVASAKNCQFIVNDEKILEFGKNDKNKYTLSYKNPIHKLMAFILAVVQIIN
jgi:hypothetical protein